MFLQTILTKGYFTNKKKKNNLYLYSSKDNF